MNNKLPKIFANKIEKKIKNNEEIYKSANIKEIENKRNMNQKEKTERKRQIPNKTISQKVNEILKTNKFLYKVPVKIKIKNNEIITNIIGKNNKNIITIDNELIKIDEIENIEIYEKNE